MPTEPTQGRKLGPLPSVYVGQMPQVLWVWVCHIAKARGLLLTLQEGWPSLMLSKEKDEEWRKHRELWPRGVCQRRPAPCERTPAQTLLGPVIVNTRMPSLVLSRAMIRVPTVILDSWT